MKGTLVYASLALICMTFSFPETRGQFVQHFLKFVPSGRNPYTGKPQLSSASPPELLQSINIFTRNADSVCAYGIWALYSRPNFGTGLETSTTVIPMLSSDLSNCTKVAGLGGYQSARYLGNLNPTETGVNLYNLPNFLGNSSTPNSTNFSLVDPSMNITGFKLGSIAITGKDSWLICGEDTCTNINSTICVNMAAQSGGTLFMVANAPTDRTTKWPGTVVRVKTVPSDGLDCAKFPNPPAPPPSALEILSRRK